MLPLWENETDPEEEHPSASSLLFQLVPPMPVFQLLQAALLLNPAPGIKSRLDCWVQHLPLVQVCPDPVLQAWAHVPQLAGSVLVFVQTPLQRVSEQEQLPPEHV
jgi:hypothetical protein